MTRRLRRGRVAAAAAVVLLLAILAGGYAASRSSWVHARTLRVVGADVRPTHVVLREAGLSGETDVLRVDEAAVVRRLLAADPWIASARLERRLPSTLILHVRERIAVAAAGTDGIAADGVRLPGADLQGLPLVRTTDGSALDPASLAAVGEAVEALPPAWRRGIDTILVLPDGTIRLAGAGRPTVIWGGGGEAAAKIVALRAVAAWVEEHERRPTVIDVSVPTAPSIRLESGSTVIP